MRLIQLFIFTLGLAPLLAQANLIINGDFEADTVSGTNAGSGYEYVTSASLTGWTVNDVTSPIRGAVLFNSLYGQGVGSGANSLQIEDYGDSINQVISTVIGQEYELLFDISAYSSPGSASVEVGIDANTFLVAGSYPSYVTQSILFTASATNTTISFTQVNSGGRYPHLDNISVTETAASVPAAPVWLLLAAGLIGVNRATQRNKP
ncbi:MAG: DUF642 domain-containing protein [Gammaproteobacteria bacterium]